MAYSESTVSDALALLVANRGNVKATALRLGVSRSTLVTWRDTAANPTTERESAVAEKTTHKKTLLADRLEALAHSLIDDLGDEARRIGNVSQVAVALGIAIDKARLLRGESTAITETRTVDDRRADILGKLRRVSAN